LNFQQTFKSAFKRFLKPVLTLILFSLLPGLLLPASAKAQLFGSGPSHVKAQLISEVTSIQPGHSFWLAVRLKMDAHWHVYWRNVGDTGLPTSFDWQLPEGFSADSLQWPFPERIVEDPLVVYGYHNTQYFLTKINPSSSVKVGNKIKIGVKVSWLVCRESCVPGDTTLFIELPVENHPPTTDLKWTETFAKARSKLPLIHSDWRFSASIQDNNLVIQAMPPQWFKAEITTLTFFPYQTDLIQYKASQKFKKQGGSYRLTIPLDPEQKNYPDTLKGIIVNPQGWRGPNSEPAAEVIIPFQDKLAPVSGDKVASIWIAILFAFLGGIILNLMPCVLPVLSIKIMSLIKQAHDENTKPWKHGLVFTLGVLSAFWALAIILLLLKAGGAHLGWGFQLQSPAFVIIISVLLFLFGLSLLGVFEIGTSLTTVGGASSKYHGLTSSFISGIIATIVATPCTAPFMGTALGYALVQPGWVAITVFTFLGLGMAAPFFIVSSIPALIRFIPKPGRWMQSLEQFMGFLLLATVLWLLWVLGIQVGTNALLLILAGLLITAIGAWIYGRWGNLVMPKRTRIIAWILALIFVIGANGYVLANLDKFAVTRQNTSGNSEGIAWQPFSEEKVAQLRAEHKAVFIDFTAAWCLSCQVNDQVAFSSEEVQRKFKELQIVPLRADWTSRDEAIGKALAKYGRNSVPLYVFYAAGPNSKAKILPQIITPGIVLEAIE